MLQHGDKNKDKNSIERSRPCIISRHAGVSGSFESTFAEVNGLLTPRTNVSLFELVGKNLLFLAAFGTLADKRGQGFVLFKSGTMCRC
jgi:hypothetical protein